MKRIEYKLKETNANTQYVEIRKSNLDWILTQCEKLVSVANACKTLKIDGGDGAELFKPNVLMPKMSTGQRNSAYTMCEGIINNFKSSGNNAQRDLTDKTMKGLTEAFKTGFNIIEDFDKVEFVQVDELSKIKSVIDVSDEETLFSTMFAVDSIIVTYKKK